MHRITIIFRLFGVRIFNIVVYKLIIAMCFDVCGGRFFTIISVYVNIFSDRKKMIMILRITISFVLFWQNCAYQSGEGDRRAERIIFLVHLLKFESDTATSKNIEIIRL